jgi:hypothetical protein
MFFLPGDTSQQVIIFRIACDAEGFMQRNRCFQSNFTSFSA